MLSPVPENVEFNYADITKQLQQQKLPENNDDQQTIDVVSLDVVNVPQPAEKPGKQKNKKKNWLQLRSERKKVLPECLPSGDEDHRVVQSADNADAREGLNSSDVASAGTATDQKRDSSTEITMPLESVTDVVSGEELAPGTMTSLYTATNENTGSRGSMTPLDNATNENTSSQGSMTPLDTTSHADSDLDAKTMMMNTATDENAVPAPETTRHLDNATHDDKDPLVGTMLALDTVTDQDTETVAETRMSSDNAPNEDTDLPAETMTTLDTVMEEELKPTAETSQEMAIEQVPEDIPEASSQTGSHVTTEGGITDLLNMITKLSIQVEQLAAKVDDSNTNQRKTSFPVLGRRLSQRRISHPALGIMALKAQLTGAEPSNDTDTVENDENIYQSMEDDEFTYDQPCIIKVTNIFEAALAGDLKSFCGLVESQEADLKVQNAIGNTIIHELIRISGVICRGDDDHDKSQWHTKIETMLQSVYEHCGKWLDGYHPGEARESEDSQKVGIKKLMAITNENDMTPLQLASLDGADYVVKHIINHWPYSFKPQSSDFKYLAGNVAYVMDEIDNICTLNGKSSFEYVLRRPPYEAGRILRLEPFNLLLRDKWQLHRKWRLPWFLWHLSVMTIFTMTCIYRPIEVEHVSEKFDDPGDYVRLCGEIFLVLSFLGFVYGEYIDFRNSTWQRYLHPADRYAFLQFTNRLMFILVLITLTLRWSNNYTEDVFIACSLLLGWTKSIQYLAFWKHMGMFPFVMHKILVEDVLQKFLVAFIMILIGVSTAIYCTFQKYQLDPNITYNTTNITQLEIEDFQMEDFRTFFSTVFLLIEVTFGMGEIESFETRKLSIFLFLAFLYLVNLVMMNMLIAMLSDTYTRTRKIMYKNWNWVEGILVLLIESHVSTRFKIKYEQLDKHSMKDTCLQYTKWKPIVKYKYNGKSRENLNSINGTPRDKMAQNGTPRDKKEKSTKPLNEFHVVILPRSSKLDVESGNKYRKYLSAFINREWWTL